jgi:Na+-translocating ferredoxin:NAD+ oxidoreductase subunit C
LSAPCIVIDTDGRDTDLPQREWAPCGDFARLEPGQIYERVRRAGIVGLGGAAFPSSVKLRPGRPVDTLILNGAECEPYISCDHLLMAERAEEIIGGARVILHALGARECLFGVEDNKPEAIRALQLAAVVDARIRIVVVPTRYPQGGEKQLIQALTGKEVPSEGLPLDLGIVCHNPGTARAVWRAVRYAQPLISRVVTVTGSGILRPQNFEVRFGTPVSFLVEQAGGTTGAAAAPVMGGPMMGFTLPSDEVPVVKATNCILVLQASEMRPPAPAQPCIRCGDCVTVCPAGLLPQQLYWHARAREYDKARALNLFDCIECGCCAHVCPSHIPLVQYYRHAKTEIWNDEREKQLAQAARERFELRKLRLEREEQAKIEARRRKKEELAARAAAQRAQSMSVPMATGDGNESAE